MVKIKVHYQVDKGVPIPVSRRPGLPLNELEVDESILFPKERRSYVQTRASKVAKETGKEFTVRVVDDTNCRVWRTK